MAHLRCDKHQRRVVVISDGTQVHRNGDGSKCDSPTLTIGSRLRAGLAAKEKGSEKEKGSD